MKTESACLVVHGGQRVAKTGRVRSGKMPRARNETPSFAFEVDREAGAETVGYADSFPVRRYCERSLSLYTSPADANSTASRN